MRSGGRECAEAAERARRVVGSARRGIPPAASDAAAAGPADPARTLKEESGPGLRRRGHLVSRGWLVLLRSESSGPSKWRLPAAGQTRLAQDKSRRRRAGGCRRCRADSEWRRAWRGGRGGEGEACGLARPAAPRGGQGTRRDTGDEALA